MGIFKRNFLFWLSRILSHPLISPDVIQIPLTYRCNLQCKMCTIHSNTYEDGKELSKEEIFDILRQASEMGIKEVVLTGGEPFLRNDLFEICNYCREKYIRSIVTTNGTLVNEEIAEKISSSGLGHLHFSLDGMEETNDLVRGKGNFVKTISAIKIIDELRNKYNHAPSIGIACTIMNHNLEDLPRLVECADNLNVDVINFQPLLKDNANTPDRGDVEFWIDENNLPLLDNAIEEIINFRGKHIKIYEEPDLRLFSKYYRKDLLPSDWKCFGGYKTIFICIGEDKSRLVYTCHGICGNLQEKSLRGSWISAEAKRLRKNAKKCKNPCLQACYSRVASESLLSILKRSRKS